MKKHSQLPRPIMVRHVVANMKKGESYDIDGIGFNSGIYSLKGLGSLDKNSPLLNLEVSRVIRKEITDYAGEKYTLVTIEVLKGR